MRNIKMIFLCVYVDIMRFQEVLQQWLAIIHIAQTISRNVPGDTFEPTYSNKLYMEFQSF